MNAIARWWQSMTGTSLPEPRPWMTPAVAPGGSPSGAFTAAGGLLAHERALAAALPAAPPEADARWTLNQHFFAGAGREELERRLEDGRFRIEVPEEAALLVATWLRQNGHHDRFEALLAELTPFFAHLRFYPVPAAERQAPGGGVYLDQVRWVVHRLKYETPPARIRGAEDGVRVLIERLETYQLEHGAADLVEILPTLGLPKSIVRDAARCLEAPLDELIDHGILASSERVALVVPQLATACRAAAIADPALRRVFTATERAFTRSQSRLQHSHAQARHFGDLPWIAAIAPWLGDERSAARAALRELLRDVLRAFPYTQLPVNLVQQLRALSRAAGLELPWVDELAPHFFGGVFAADFPKAAHLAAHQLRGSVYERYYGLDDGAWVALDADHPLAAERFGALCRRLAGPGLERLDSLAAQARVIEQAQILTTHNLALIFGPPGGELGLGEELDAAELAERTFTWLLDARRGPASLRPRRRHARTQAYAWRQMVYFLALLPPLAQAEVLERCLARIEHLPVARQRQLEPALLALKAIAAGDNFDPQGFHRPSGGSRVLAAHGDDPFTRTG